MQTTFRFPGSAEYSYVEITTTPGSVPDNKRELMDMDDAFLNIVGNLLAQGCSLVALGVLRPQMVEQPSYQTPQEAPQGHSQPPQEAQGYSPPQQTYQAPQYTPQPPQQAYQPPQQQYAPPTPPGQSAPVCQMHGQPANFKAAGVSKSTGRPYDAFWTCAANDRNCTKASNFPRA